MKRNASSRVDLRQALIHILEKQGTSRKIGQYRKLPVIKECLKLKLKEEFTFPKCYWAFFVFRFTFLNEFIDPPDPGRIVDHKSHTCPFFRKKRKNKTSLHWA